MLLELADRGEGSALQRLLFQDREPYLDLVEPGGAGWGDVEADPRVTLQPAIILWLE